MAEKHKSKYKRPENAKPTRRKDLKDYTADDKAGALNPYSTGKKQERVARKTDKAVQDDGKMFPKYTEKDRLYKKIEDGDYDPKHAMNVLRKRQEIDTDEYFDTREKIDHGVTTSDLDERISRLSKKQKEINELNFKTFEEKFEGSQVFDELFDQSFVEIQHDYQNIYSINKLLSHLEDVEYSTDIQSDFSKINLENRLLMKYKTVVEWSEIFMKIGRAHV